MSKKDNAPKAPSKPACKPVYRERTVLDAALQADHPLLLVGCACGWQIDAEQVSDGGGVPGLARAHVYAQHVAPPDETPARQPDVIIIDALDG